TLPAEHTNASTDASEGDGAPRLLPLSARSPEALRALAERWQAWLGQDRAPLADVLYTACERRTHHDLRLAVVGRSAEALRARLGDFLQGRDSPALATGQRPASAPARLAFVFGGQGP